nr:hypothetical protein [Tanacetum cinerariifolium]
MESDELIKSSVENLVPSLSESKDLFECKCDVPAYDDFTAFSNLLFDVDDDFSSSNDNNDSLSLPENESFHFDIPSSLLPPAKPPDDDEIEPNSGILTVKMLKYGESGQAE